MSSKKPPLGVKPQWLWRENRIDDLIAAIRRRPNGNRVSEYLSEIEEHRVWLENEGKL